MIFSNLGPDHVFIFNIGLSTFLILSIMRADDQAHRQLFLDFRPLSSIQDLASLDHIARCKCVQLIKAHFVAKWKMLFGLDLMAFFISPIHTYISTYISKRFFSLWPFQTPLIKQFTYFSQSIVLGYFLWFCHRVYHAGESRILQR